MTIHFGYDKKQVIQALRYHFLTRPEIKVLFVLVNVFAIFSAVLFFLKKIQPISFLVFSTLWFLLMLVLWRLLPTGIYKRSHTFQDNFSMSIDENEALIWNFFLTNNLLYSIDPALNKNYVQDGPKTEELGEASPGYIGLFIGWQIVKKYMAKNDELTLPALMQTNAKKIFEESKYKPK